MAEVGRKMAAVSCGVHADCVDDVSGVEHAPVEFINWVGCSGGRGGGSGGIGGGGWSGRRRDGDRSRRGSGREVKSKEGTGDNECENGEEEFDEGGNGGGGFCGTDAGNCEFIQ